MRKITAILTAMILAGGVNTASAQTYSQWGIPTEFGLVGDAGPYYYGRIVPPGPVYTQPPGPLSRMGTVRTIDGSLTGGNRTRTGALQYSGTPELGGIPDRVGIPAPPSVGINERHAVSGITGALSGSYRAGVGGVGGLADLPPAVAVGPPGGGGAIPPFTGTAVNGATQPVTYAPAVDPQAVAEFQNGNGAIRQGPPNGDRTFTATYDAVEPAEYQERDAQPRRTLEK